MASPVERGGNPAKSRFVVNLDQPSPGGGGFASGKRRNSSGGGGGLKILGIIAIVLLGILLAALAGGYYWWRGYQQRPAYSLALLVDAAQRDDQQAIEQYADLDRISSSFIPQVITEARRRLGAPQGIENLARGQYEDAVTRLTPGLRQSVRDEVMRQAREVGARAANVPFFVVALAVPYVVDSVREEGNNATVALKIGDRNVELTMERNNDRWKIVGVRDEALAARIVNEAMERAGSAGAGLTRDLLRNIPGLNPGGRGRGNQNRRRDAQRALDNLNLSNIIPPDQSNNNEGNNSNER